MPESLDFDFDALTPRMLRDFRDQAGVSLFSLLDDDGELALNDLTEDHMAGMIWLALRMNGQPDATWDDALDTPFSRLAFADAEGEADPTTAS